MGLRCVLPSAIRRRVFAPLADRKTTPRSTNNMALREGVGEPLHARVRESGLGNVKQDDARPYSVREMAEARTGESIRVARKAAGTLRACEQIVRPA
jgi:hypothetical protein